MVSEDIVIISGKKLRCLICGFSEFKKVHTKLNRKWLAILGAEMFGEEGVAYICKNCGYKLEFYPKR